MSKKCMRIVLGGVRGSLPVTEPGFSRFGGATTCVMLDDGCGARIVFDAGTGLRTLQPLLAASGAAQPVLMLFTHYHLDHVIGLPPFAPLYDPAWHAVVAAPPREGVTARRAITRLMGKPFWPAPFRARLRFRVLPETCDKPFRHGPFDVRWCAVHHANGCHAYRVDERETGASMVFATDLEWSESSARERRELARLCTAPGPVDVLIMEGHDDAKGLTGWGHSSWQEAADVARLVRARRLVVTHLAPDDDDATLAARSRRLRAALPGALLGRQGLRLAWRKG